MLNYIRNQMGDEYKNTPAKGEAIEDTIYGKSQQGGN